MDPRPINIFYSWQSDLPNTLNRGFIEDALGRATKDAKGADASSAPITFLTAVDRDTRGHLGSPDIAATIFSKIASADIFVADVSIVGTVRPVNGIEMATHAIARVLGMPTANLRATPNPNVMAEVGFAAGTLGWDRIVCVCNEAFGAIEQLPFDLRGRSMVAYRLPRGEAKAKVRSELVAKLRARLLPLLRSAWQAHRPHPLRFAAYADVSLITNRFFQKLAGIHYHSRAVATNDDWDRILTRSVFEESLAWTHVDVPLTFAGDVRALLGVQLARDAAEFREGAGRALARYGERLDSQLYEALHQAEDSPFVHTLSQLPDGQRLDARAGWPRPRVLASYVALTDRDLAAFRAIISWCSEERAKLAAYDPEIRHVVSPSLGQNLTPGQWRIPEADLKQQLAVWHDPARSKKPQPSG